MAGPVLPLLSLDHVNFLGFLTTMVLIARKNRFLTSGILGLVLVVGLSACRDEERDRILLYKKGVYLGQANPEIPDETLRALADRTVGQAGPSGHGPAAVFERGFSSAVTIDSQRINQQAGPTTGLTAQPSSPAAVQPLGPTGDRIKNQADADPGLGALKAASPPLAMDPGQSAPDQPVAEKMETKLHGNRAPILSGQQRQQLENRLSRQQDF